GAKAASSRVAGSRRAPPAGARPRLLDRLPPGARSLRAPTLRGLRYLAAAAFAALALFLLGTLAAAVASAVTRPLPTDVRFIPLALLASTLRLLVAYVIALAWTIPAAIYIARNERAAKVLLPTAEVLASIPAIAIFPLIILVFFTFTRGLDIPSIALVLTGMQWYLLFNLIAGARSLPPELSECASIFGVKGFLYWRRVIVPAMLPSLVTGSITAWGGGWNALIVSEYVQYRGDTLHAFGIGDFIGRATFDSHDTTLLLFSVLAMVVYIYVLNRLVWKRLYARVLVKYKIEAA
ncbi:MAG: ABC transporter permease subunit, partial [Thermoplasmatota archaeon]